MDAWRLVGRRALARRGLLVLVGVVVALTAAAAAGGVGYATVAARDGLRATLTGAAPQDAAVRIHTRLAAEPDAQRSAADEVLAETLPDLPVTVHTSRRSVSLPGESGGASVGDVVLGADGDLADHVHVVEGMWPVASDDAGAATRADSAADGVPAALTAHAAARLGLGLGDAITVTGDADATLTVEVVALWEATDPEDPRWFGDPLVSGHGDLRDGDGDESAVPAALAVVTDDTVAAAPAMVLTRWTLVPDTVALTPQDLPALRSAVVAAGDRLRDDDRVAVQGLAVVGGLAGTLARTDTALTAVRGVTTSLVLAAVLVAAVALTQVARLLATVRGRETAVLRSRGTSLPQLAGAALAEALVVVVPAAAAGAVLAGLALRAFGTPPVEALVGAGVLTALAASALLTGTAVSRAVAGAREDEDAGRSGAGVGTGVLALVSAAAGLAWWQLTRYGSPAFVGVDGRAHVDPLAAAALPLLLLTVALVAVALLRPTAALAARRAERRSGLMPVLTRRQLSRRTPVHAVTAVLVTLAVATGTFVAVQVGTWQSTREAAAEARAGADVRVTLAPRALDDLADPSDPYRDLPGVEHAVSVRTGRLAIGRDGGSLVALPGAGLEHVLLGLGTVGTPATPLRDLLAEVPDRSDALPVVLTEAWAEDLALVVGDTTRGRVLGADVEVVVVGTTPVVPGADRASGEGEDDVVRAALADLDVLDLLPAPGHPPQAPAEIWLATAPSDRATVAAAAAALPTTADVMTAAVPGPASRRC